MQSMDWDDAFANMAYVENSHLLPDFWANRAASYRAELSDRRLEEDIPYGDEPRQKLDIVWPDGAPKGLAVFVHGGFWMRLNKSHWTDFAEGMRVAGWAVCIPSYTLTPQARIAQITREIGRAITVAAARVDGPIHLAGHSAGGHLATRMLCNDCPLEPEVQARIEHTLSISGLHDLRPLMHTKMNETLKLDAQEARAESAVLRDPVCAGTLTCWVGWGERPEFIRQTSLLPMMWQGLGVAARHQIEGSHNHFTVLEGLKLPNTPITDAFLGSAKLKGTDT